MLASPGLLGTVIQAGMIGGLPGFFGDKAVAITGMIIFMASIFTLPVGPTIRMLVIATTQTATGNRLAGQTGFAQKVY